MRVRDWLPLESAGMETAGSRDDQPAPREGQALTPRLPGDGAAASSVDLRQVTDLFPAQFPSAAH